MQSRSCARARVSVPVLQSAGAVGYPRNRMTSDTEHMLELFIHVSLQTLASGITIRRENKFPSAMCLFDVVGYRAVHIATLS